MAWKRMRGALCAFMGLAFAMAFAATPAFAGESNPSYVAGVSNEVNLATQSYAGWVDAADGRAYYVDGERLVGLQAIGDKRYYFSDKGVMCTSDVTAGGATFYIRGDGVLLGAKYNGAYYYDTLKQMTGDDSYDFDTFLWARSIVRSITYGGDSNETKRWKAFCWVRDKYYAIHQDFSPYQTNWMAVYARYHFADSGGDCHSDAAAFAYLAAAIGYEAYACIDSWNSGYAPSHSWTMIDGAVYDPLFYESKGSMYYGATSGTYEIYPTASFRVPTYNADNNRYGAVSQDLINAGSIGLKKTNGKLCYYEKGALVKNAWRTVNGKRYYFKGDGEAATYLTRIGDANYLFDRHGVLQSSTESGLRIVKMNNAAGEKTLYQVNRSGKAVGGWSKDKTRYANSKGILVAGQWKTIDGKRYYFRKSGVRVAGSVMLKGTCYVFDRHGVLQRGLTSGSKTTLVKVNGAVYRVDKAGRAMRSVGDEWRKGDMMRFDKTGMLLTGVRFLSKQDRFYAANKNGVFKPKLTAELNAAKRGYASGKKSAVKLRRVLNKAGIRPVNEFYVPSCDIKGDDGLWEYRHFVVMTGRPSAVLKLYQKMGYDSIDDLIAAGDAIDSSSPVLATASKKDNADVSYEYLRSITAL